MPASLAREIAILKKIASHPHVVHLVEAVELGHGDDRVALGGCFRRGQQAAPTIAD